MVTLDFDANTTLLFKSPPPHMTRADVYAAPSHVKMPVVGFVCVNSRLETVIGWSDEKLFNEKRRDEGTALSTLDRVNNSLALTSGCVTVSYSLSLRYIALKLILSDIPYIMDRIRMCIPTLKDVFLCMSHLLKNRCVLNT